MRPAKIDRHTIALHPPADWDREVNGHCGVLHIRAEQIDGVDFMRSAWEAEHDEALFLLAGGKLVLGVAGRVNPERPTHPVIHIALEQLPDDFQPAVAARQFATLAGQQAVRVEMLFSVNGTGRRAFVEIGLEGTTYPDAVAQGMVELEKLAKREEWIE